MCRSATTTMGSALRAAFERAVVSLFDLCPTGGSSRPLAPVQRTSATVITGDQFEDGFVHSACHRARIAARSTACPLR